MIRLFVDQVLNRGASITVTKEQSHFLGHVMRLKNGDRLALFNGVDGEWEASVDVLGKHGGRLLIGSLLRDLIVGPDLDLIVALVKRSRLETIVEKAAELGARRLRLITTERTNADHTKVARLRSIAIESAEQCGRLEVPEILEPVKLEAILDSWDGDRWLMFCDEAGDAAPAVRALATEGRASWAILIGPEGGFSPHERARIRALPTVTPMSLGPRILRADTAAIAAMVLWQSMLGDWREPQLPGA